MSEDEQTQDNRPRMTHLSGNLGQDPKEIDTKKGTVVKFSLATPITDGSKDNPGDTFWCDLSIFDEKMKERALAELHKGDKIVAVGELKTREYEGREFYQMIPRRISHVDWWEKEPYIPREQQESAEWVAPF